MPQEVVGIRGLPILFLRHRKCLVEENAARRKRINKRRKKRAVQLMDSKDELILVGAENHILGFQIDDVRHDG